MSGVGNAMASHDLLERKNLTVTNLTKVHEKLQRDADEAAKTLERAKADLALHEGRLAENDPSLGETTLKSEIGKYRRQMRYEIEKCLGTMKPTRRADAALHSAPVHVFDAVADLWSAKGKHRDGADMFLGEIVKKAKRPDATPYCDRHVRELLTKLHYYGFLRIHERSGGRGKPLVISVPWHPIYAYFKDGKEVVYTAADLCSDP